MSKGIIASLWFVSAVICFVAGFLVASGPYTDTPESPSVFRHTQNNAFDRQEPPYPETHLNEASVDDIDTTSQVPTSDEGHQAPSLNAYPPDKLLREVRQLLDGTLFSLNLKQLSEIYALISQMSVSEIEDVIRLIPKEGSSQQNFQPVMIFFAQLAEHDPMHAMSMLKSTLKDPQLEMMGRSSVMQVWAKKDPLAAFEFVLNEDPRQSHAMFRNMGVELTPIFSHLAKQDIQLTLEKLRELEDANGNVSAAITGAINGANDTAQITGFIEEMEQFDDPYAYDFAVTAWVQKSPVDAAQWLDTAYNGEQSLNYKRQALAVWGMSDFDAATQWYMQSASPAELSQRINDVASHLSYVSPQQTLDWVERQTNVDTQEAITRILNTSAYQNTDFARQHLHKVQSENEQINIAMNIYYALGGNNSEQAKGFLDTYQYREALLLKLDEINAANRPQEVDSTNDP
uniref:hypothetical protein n=1 Tax=Ningiella ruwaisensis TaxID=2364274 RepID=UPI00109EEE76|nr:hypothetical protein [Ningiella ruwaisensis]